ncbi:MAG TPA: hypothetical protein DIU11_03480, partial [Pusillimonas sp.]|nr:hypothetical protein [Pusillimonas sp.]
MMPIVVTGIVGRIAKLGSAALSASTATSGGLVGGGAAIEEARRTIDRMDDETLEQESKVYRDLLADGKSPDEARQEVRTQAENWASAITMPVSTLGGGLFGRAISPAGRVLGSGGVAAQTAGGALATGAIEGSQELGEGVATATGINRGAGTSLNPLEGSFGNALLGAIGGAAPGAVQGFSQGVSTRSIPVTKSLEPSDITQNGRPFMTLPAAQRAAIEAGDNAQIYRLGNRFVVRKSRDAGSEFMDSVEREPADSETADQAPQESAEGQPLQGDGSVSQEFERGQRVFISQNGRSMPVEFLGYESNSATASAGGERIARIRTPEGRGYFVRVGDLVAQQPEPEQAPALPAGQQSQALSNESEFQGAGDGFVMSPAQNFEIPENAPRGVRNNNPGNIEKGVGFQGEIDGNDSRFATFDSPESGIRALAVNLLTYQEKHGLNDVRSIINRWAPSNENNTNAYVQTVADAVGVSPDQEINLRDPNTMERLTTAIIEHENGMQPYELPRIQTGIRAALAGEPVRAGALPAPTIAVDSAGRASTANQRNENPDPALGLSRDVANARRNHPGAMDGVSPGVVVATGTNADAVDRAAHEAQTSPENDLPEPTQAQIEAGNYKKGHVNVEGLDVSIENPQGSTRSGVDPDGNSWSRKLASHYGYIRKTNSADGEQLDAFIKPGVDPSEITKAYVIDQVDPKTGKFDEAKVMLGYGSQEEAQAAYLENYEPDWNGLGAINEMDMAQLKNWIKDGDTRNPAADFAATQIGRHAQQPIDPALGLIASNLTNPSNNKPFVTRSKAQAYADEVGGHVVRYGNGFRVRNEIPGMDVPAPGADRESDPETTVYTPNGRPVDVRYRVVEADSLQASHTDAGQRNPRYPAQLQPRDRSRGTSDLQINEIAQNLQPDLVGVSANTSDGAPIISYRGTVESGNGRAMGIKRAYSQDTEGAKRYRKWLKDQGYDVDNMRAPVLVRQRDSEMSPRDLQAYTRESNERTTLQMSPTEQAQSDAKQVMSIVGDYVGGDIASAANRDFVRKFIRDVVSSGDRGAMVGSDGILSQPGKKRIEAALMAAAYDSPEIVTDLFESADNDIKSIGGALLDVSGLWAKMREEARTDQIPADMDTTQHLVDAVNIVRRARSEGKGVYDLANQNDMLSGPLHSSAHQFLRTFFRGERFTRAYGRDRGRDTLSNYVALARSTVPGENMFGDPAPTGDQVLRQINERQQANETTARQQGLLTGTDGNAAGNEAVGRQTQRPGTEGLRRPTNDAGERSENVAPKKSSDNNKKPTASKIDDFGEKLEGARKDYATSYADDLNAVKDDDIASVPLSQSWPAPNYEQLLNEGKDPLAVGFLRAVRDAVPTKPRTRYKVKSWASKVKELRSMANTILDMDAKAGREFINSAKTGQLADTVIFQAEMYAELGHDKPLTGLSLSRGQYGMYDGVEYDPPKVLWTVERPPVNSSLGSWPRQIASGDTREQAISNFKKAYPRLGDKKQEKKGVSFSIYSRRGQPGYHIGKKVGNDYIDLKQFDDISEARKYLANNQDQLVKLLEKAKWVPDVRRETNQPRVGADHRQGVDVTPEMFDEAFGFRGVQFGNYVEGGRRQEDLNEAYDALMDMAGILEVPPRAISLNGELGLAFGARGKGGARAAAAHYEPGKIVINLTKKSGAGSLAHEWWHALDNYFARQDGRPNEFMTEALRSKGGVRPKMTVAFDAVTRTVRGNAMFERSKNLDKRRTKAYWSTNVEMTARAFESYIINKLKDQGRSNDYLANIVDEAQFSLENAYPYPTAGEIKGVRAAFDNFFRTVEKKETSRGIALESRSQNQPPIKLNSFAREIKGVIDEVTKNLPGAAGLKVDVVNNTQQIPEEYRPSVHAEGVYVPSGGTGVVYLVADNLPGLERAKQVLAHEIVGHYGMEALLGDKFSDVLADIERLTAIPDGVKLGIQRPGDKYYATLEAVKMDYPDYSTENQAREVLARMAETDVRPYFLERVYGYIRKFLRSIGLAGRYSGAEIKNMVVESAKRLRDGTPEQSRAGVLSAAESLTSREADATPLKKGATEIEVDGVMRPALNSDGQPIHPTTEGVRNFWRWFADSKVVDEQGRPMVVYHGTNANFAEFNRDMVGANTGWDNARLGFFFIGNKSLAQDFLAQTSGGSNIIDAYLSIQKPIRLDQVFNNESQASTLYEIFTGDKLDAKSALDWINEEIGLDSYGDIAEVVSTDEAIEILRRDGFDGVISDFGAGNLEYVAFDPQQIKSATGNTGRFDSANPNILESRAATMGEIPTGAEDPRRRNPVERPGENLGEVERKLRERALGKIGAFAEVKPMRERAQELTKDMPKKLQQGIFDQFAPLKNLNITAYMQARLSKGTDGAAESLLRFGKVSLKDGAYEVDNSGGLAKVLSQLKGEHNYFFAWIAGNRAERLMAEGRENLFTPENIQQLKNLSRGDRNFPDRAQVYEKALKEFNDLQKSVMDVAEEAGLLDPESRHLWEHEFYVPFYRVMEEDQSGFMGPGQINGLVGQRAFKKLKGGQEKLGDLLENTLSNWSHLLSASMKNMAAQKSLKSAEEIGVADRIPSAEKGSVRVMVKGKERHYLVDDPFVLDALTALSYMGPTSPVMKAMQKAKRYLTTGVTVSPTFRVRNLLRDTISAIAVNDLSYNPIRNGMAGWKGTNSESPTYRKLVAGGGAIRFGAFNDGDQSANIQRLIDRGVDPEQVLDSQAKVKRLFRGFFDWYQETGDRAETINRAAVYEQAIKNGKSHLEASYIARDLMDFSLGGSFASIRFLTQVVPFFNARLQGMYKLGRAAKNDPRRFAAVTGAVAMASALFYFMGKDDEEYEQLPDWVRNTYWVVRIPSTGKFVYIPKPFEVGALGTVVERMTELMFSGDDYKAKDFANTMTHVVSDQLAMNPVPQLFKPVMGAFFNYDDFRGVNIDSMGQMRLPAEDRYRASTSAGAVALGQALNMSPQRIEFLVRGYFGWLGSQALNVADLAARPLTDMPSNP